MFSNLSEIFFQQVVSLLLPNFYFALMKSFQAPVTFGAKEKRFKA